jgi:hypothetical protein
MTYWLKQCATAPLNELYLIRLASFLGILVYTLVLTRMTASKFTLTILTLFCFVACTNRAERAAEYNDSIIQYQKSIVDALVVMDSTFTDTNATRDHVGYSFANLQSKVKLAILALDSIGSFQKDPSLQLSARELFRNYEELVDVDYKKLLTIKLMPAESVDVAVVDSNFAIQSHIHMQSKLAQEKFLKSQEEFGKKFHLEFE